LILTLLPVLYFKVKAVLLKYGLGNLDAKQGDHILPTVKQDSGNVSKWS